jgi:A/G-specific adenine glycosylase
MSLPPEPVRARLLAWYDANARDLPWRRTRDPYRIWVSEIMLQQTRVETVIPYYGRWVERFPSVEALAAAPLERVLEVWTGLGYYSRARNLHRAAGTVRDEHAGRVPPDPVALRALPGVGEYTAGAISSIAFELPEPAVDGNVKRVLSRLLDLAEPTARAYSQNARALIDPDRPGDFNQAVMELGATVCRPRAPLCDECPLAQHCLAWARGTVSERPAPRKRKTPPHRRFGLAVLARNDGRFLVRRRPEQGLLGGMLEFPNREYSAGEDPSGVAADELASLARWTGPMGTPEALGTVEHAFTHFRATYHVYLFGPNEPIIRSTGPVQAQWLDGQLADEVALPVAQQRVARLAREAAEGRDRVKTESKTAKRTGWR